MDSPFVPYLIDDEQILWAGQPDPWALFTYRDLLLLPVGAFFGVVAAADVQFIHNHGLPPVVAPLMLLTLFAGLYLNLGRFIYKWWAKKSTYYAVTDRRVMVITRRFMLSAFIATLPSTAIVRFTFGGTRTVRFGWHYRFDVMENSGAGSGFRGDLHLAFYDIHDASRVVSLIEEVKTIRSEYG